MNMDEALRRIRCLFEIMHHNVADGRRVRIQVFAFVATEQTSRTHAFAASRGIDENTVIPPEGLLIEPIAVRALNGHTGSASEREVVLKRDLKRLTAGAVTAIPNCFHVTSRENLMGTFERGIQPGGGSGRSVTYFSSFAPWDERSWKISKGTYIRGERAVFYMKTETLMDQFEGRITDSGQPVTDLVIPFASLRGAWVQDSGMNWHRLIVPSGPEQLVRSVYRPWRYANREEVMKEARACAEEVEYEDAKAADIIDTVCAFENRTIKLGGAKEKEAHFKLLYYIVEHRAVEIAGCITCPACLKDTPAKYSICLKCKGMMTSYGRRPFVITEDERENDPGDAMDVDDQDDEPCRT